MTPYRAWSDPEPHQTDAVPPSEASGAGILDASGSRTNAARTRRRERWPSATRARVVAASLLALLSLLAATPHACEPREPTRAASLGPHDFSAAPPEKRLWRDGDPGRPLVLQLRVLDTCGAPIPSASVHLLHADQDGVHHPDRYRARLSTDERGALEVITVYPGYAGGMARHVHVIIAHPDFERLVTRLFFKNDPAADGLGIDELSMVVEELRFDDKTRWLAGYEFVLAPRAR